MNGFPKLLLRFLRWFCRPELLQFIEGDLLELFEEHQAAKGLFRARVMMIWEVLKLFRPGIVRSFQNNSPGPVFVHSMIRSSFRRLLRERTYAATNMLGLVVGLVAYLCVWIYVNYERHFDEFLPGHEEVYRIDENWNRSGVEEKWSAIKARVTPYVNANFPGVASVRLFQGIRAELQVGDKTIDSDKNFYIDSTFMEVFRYAVVEGEAKAMMQQPGTVILTETIAQKLFGNRPALHQALTLKGRSYMVSGVLQDPPANSHLHFEVLIVSRGLDRMKDFQLNDNMFYTYVRVSEHQRDHLLKTLNEELSSLRGYAQDLGIEGNSCYLSMLPLHDIHLHGDAERELEQNSSAWVVNLIEMIGWFILIMSGINYVNLSTSRSMGRIAEAGIRKLHGSQHWMIALQFLTESVLLCLLSMVIAVGVSYLLLPVFNQYFRIDVQANWVFVVQLVQKGTILALVVGAFAGIYPALSLARVSIMGVLRTISSNKGAGRMGVRRGFITFQLMISVFTIMATTVIYRQLQFIQDKNLGFDRSRLMVIPLNPFDRYDAIGRFKESLMGEPEIANASTVYTYPGLRFPFFTYRFPNLNRTGQVNATLDDGSVWMRSVFGDEDMPQTFGLELVDGRLDAKTSEDNVPNEFIVNEAAVRFLGVENPIGETVEFTYANENPDRGRIVGVVRDFNYASLHHAVEPMIMSATDIGWSKRFMLISLATAPKEVATKVEGLWRRYMGNAPLTYHFLNDEYKELYKNEAHLKVFLIVLAAISIVISILGLLGMSFFAMEQRKHEIGIRKVLGASVLSIVSITTREYLLMMAKALLVVIPVTYWLAGQWLNRFAYAIAIGPGIVVGTVGFVAALVLGSVGFNVMRSAMKNPVQMIDNG